MRLRSSIWLLGCTDTRTDGQAAGAEPRSSQWQQTGLTSRIFYSQQKIIKTPVSLDGNMKINFHVACPWRLACRCDLLWLTGSTQTRVQSSPRGNGLRGWVSSWPRGFCSFVPRRTVTGSYGFYTVFGRRFLESKQVTRRKTIDSALSWWSRWSSPKEIRILKNVCHTLSLTAFQRARACLMRSGVMVKDVVLKLCMRNYVKFGRSVQLLEWFFY